MEGFNAEVGERIRKARKNKKLSMKKLGEMLNLHESTISRYEKGEIQALDIDKLKEFADVLNVSPMYLMGYETQEEQVTKSERGKRLFKLRKEKDNTIEEVAEKTKIPVTDLTNYEKGYIDMPLEHVRRLSSYYCVPVDSLLAFNTNDNDSLKELINNMDAIRNAQRWNDEVGLAVFSDEEMTDLIKYAKYILSQRKSDDEDEKD